MQKWGRQTIKDNAFTEYEGNLLDWDQILINCGYPILSIGFSYSKLPGPLVEPSLRLNQQRPAAHNQYLAVSLEVNSSEEKGSAPPFHGYQDTNLLNKMHLFGRSYAQPGLVALFKIKFTAPSGKQAESPKYLYQQPKLQFCIRTDATAQLLKWAPQYQPEDS